MAMVTVIVGVMVVGLFTAILLQTSLLEYQSAQAQRWDDVTIAGTEAMLERYASKLTIDPAYYQHRVDEAEEARVCDDPTDTAHYGTASSTVQPGNAWYPACKRWTYTAPTPNVWYQHPLLDGSSAGTGDNIESRIHVTPPDVSTPVVVTVASRQVGRNAERVVQASVKAQPLSEFAWSAAGSLQFGDDLDQHGRIYVGGDLTFLGGQTHRDVYAEGTISVSSDFDFVDGAQGYDGDSGTSYGNIRTQFPTALNFDNFWQDLSVIKDAACTGTTLTYCLNDASAKAYLVQPYVSGGVGRIKIWKSTYSAPSSGCVTSEEWWWSKTRNSTSPYALSTTPNWVVVGDYTMPTTGVLWANADVIVGNPSGPGGDFGTDKKVHVKGSLTIYAGSSSNPKNVVINTDVRVDTSTNDTVALIGSNRVVVNPYMLTDNAEHQIDASLLSQTNQLLVSRSCGTDGVELTDASETHLTFLGSIAQRGNTGSIYESVHDREYIFDQRLEYLRPPFYPLLEDEWHYEDWRELGAPDWAR